MDSITWKSLAQDKMAGKAGRREEWIPPSIKFPSACIAVKSGKLRILETSLPVFPPFPAKKHQQPHAVLNSWSIPPVFPPFPAKKPTTARSLEFLERPFPSSLLPGKKNSFSRQNQKKRLPFQEALLM
jgi:hypothetical protein